MFGKEIVSKKGKKKEIWVLESGSTVYHSLLFLRDTFP